ncbi:MAG TPA: hypothetical protein VFH08_15920 [Chitinophagaceae bacterium]|nr:hypothetical protein [Chitinophagaceae bacterium]
MDNKTRTIKVVFSLLFALGIFNASHSQMITGVWKGKIDKKKAELKLIQKGDSLLGTSYYYESENNYRRYSIRGYFDPNTNEAVWWDDQLLEEKTGKFSVSTPGKIPYLSSADFNCPGSDKMFLDGDAALKNRRGTIQGPVHLEKTNQTIFPDEWDFIIDNYTAGASDPYYIDSIAMIAAIPETVPEEKIVQPTQNDLPTRKKEAITKATLPVQKAEPVKATPLPKNEQRLATKKSIEEEFKIREKVIAADIPLTGDSIELRFYDNAEIDGDSISLFLNNRLIFEHIRLTGTAYTIKLPVNELNENNELVMVAENLGSIPPNTSYMLAIVNEKRYEAMLKSTEETSAVIRLTKPKDQTNKAVKN